MSYNGRRNNRNRNRNGRGRGRGGRGRGGRCALTVKSQVHHGRNPDIAKVTLGQIGTDWFLITAGGSQIKIWKGLADVVQTTKKPKICFTWDLASKFSREHTKIHSMQFVGSGGQKPFLIVGLEGCPQPPSIAWTVPVGFVHVIEVAVGVHEEKDHTLKVSEEIGYTHAMAVSAIASAMDQGIIISGGKEGLIRIWKFNKAMKSFLHLAMLEGHARKITSLQLVAGRLYSSSEDCTVNLWDCQTLKLLYSTRIKSQDAKQCHSQTVTALAPYLFRTTNTQYVVSASYDSTIRLWNTKDMTCVKKYDGCRSVVIDMTVLYQPGMDVLVCGSKDGSVVCFELPEIKYCGTVKGHSRSAITGVASYGTS